MQGHQFFNKELPVVEDLLQNNTLLNANTSNRWMDSRSWGIVHSNAFISSLNIPVSGNHAVPNNVWNINEFPILFNTNTGMLSIGQGSNQASNPQIVGGLAYNMYGDRIYIPEDQMYSASNTGPAGAVSSGNINIPLPSPSSTPNYVWISYLATPDPTYQDVGSGGVIAYPRVLDGYQITLTTTPVAPQGDGVSIFLCKVIWAASFPGTLTVTAGEVTQTNGNLLSTIPTATSTDPHRVYSLIRDTSVEIEVDSTNNPTATYAVGGRYTLKDHVNAVGAGTPSPRNPHGTTLADIGGTNLEPLATELATNGLDQGIIDLSLTNNSPAAQSTALQMSLNQTTLQPLNLATQGISGSGINSNEQRSWVRVAQLQANQFVYVGGQQVSFVYPTLASSDHASDPSINPAVPGSGDGWIGFSTISDTTPGTFRLFGTFATVNGLNVLLLQKELLTGFPGAYTPALTAGQFELGFVYWDGSNVWRDYLAVNSTDVVDRRSFGLVGPEQISTRAKSSPDAGASSRSIQTNLVGNSQFSFNKVTTANESSDVVGQFPGWTIVTTNGGSFLPLANFAQEALTGTAAPGALTGIQITPIAAQNTGYSYLYGTLDRVIKPNTYYCISFWYQTTDSTWNTRMRVGVNANNTGTESPVITTGSPAGFPLDVLVTNDGTMHRATLVVQTNGAVTPANQYFLEFRFDASSGGSTSSAITITNIQIEEGEWVTGYKNNRGLPSGAIIIWDQNSSCPPGFSQVTSLNDRFPVGADNNAVQAKSTVTMASSGSLSTTLSIPPLTVTDADGATLYTSGGTISGSDTAEIPNAPHGHNGAIQTAASSVSASLALPFYGVLFCRAL